jgi:transcriptional regulator with XRE-family HTH domain
MKPDASKHNPDPAYLRSLIEAAGLSQRAAAIKIGITDRTMRYYLSGERDAPYSVQFALENLPKRKATCAAVGGS